eukprot:jgi/Mesen1/6152/ME000314S05154
MSLGGSGGAEEEEELLRRSSGSASVTPAEPPAAAVGAKTAAAAAAAAAATAAPAGAGGVALLQRGTLVARRVMGDEWVGRVGLVAWRLRELGLGALSEEAYVAVTFLHLQKKVVALSKGQFEQPALPAIRLWI